MPIAPYDPCPCGSGKKLKFCCQPIADEMDRALRLMEGNQPRVALQQLESLARKHPANTWIGTTRALILIELGEATTARDILRALLELHPDHEFSIVLLAASIFQAEGFDAAKKSVHRAFQRGAKKFPSMVSGLAATMASVLFQRQRLMSAREHLSLALRLAPEDRRQELFIQLLEFDGDTAIPYPIRGSHSLPSVHGTDEQQKEVKKAQKYAAVGCWNTAADLFQALTRTITDSPELWHSVGLCRAWDGDEVAAADALHRASQLYSDVGTAVECETLAQLLDLFTTKNVIEICTHKATIESVGRLLTVLDQTPQLLRFGNLPNAPEEADGPVARYQVLDRPSQASEDCSNLTLDSLPLIQAQISIYDAMPDSNEPASLYMTGDRGTTLDAARSLVDSATQGLIQWRTDVNQPDVTGSVPAETQSLRWRWSMPGNLPIRMSREFRRQHWQQVSTDLWPNTPLQALGGISPAQAVADPSKRVPLTASVYVLDAQVQQHSVPLDVNDFLNRLGLEPLPALDINESTPLGTLSLMQMHRLPVDRLTDPQLVSVANRALLTQHEEFLYHVLKAALSRPECEKQIDLSRSLHAIVELCSNHGRRDEALHWIQVARSKPSQDKSPFEYQWNWDMTELALRLEDPTDPGLKPLLDRFVNYYSPKVPQLRGYVERMLKSYGVASPWESISLVTSSGATAAGGLWSPDAPAATAASPSKLWLPGE